MKRLAALFLILGLLAGPAAIAGAAEPPLTNASIIHFKHSGVDDASLITIVGQRTAHYDLSPSGVAALKKAGVGDTVIAAMKSAMAPAPTAPKTSAGASAPSDGQVHVFYLGASGPTEMKTGEVAAKATDQYKPGLFQFVPPTNIPTHIQYGLKGAHASFTTSTLPVFEMDIAHAYNVDPAHFKPVVLRLRTDGSDRVIGTQTSNTNVRTSMNTVDPIVDDRVPVKVDTIAPGRLRITPSQPLPPGEYGVAMRDPDVQSMTYSSSGETQTGQTMSKQQMYQSVAWDFSVQP